jgi:hypothetical protein
VRRAFPSAFQGVHPSWRSFGHGPGPAHVFHPFTQLGSYGDALAPQQTKSTEALHEAVGTQQTAGVSSPQLKCMPVDPSSSVAWHSAGSCRHVPPLAGQFGGGVSAHFPLGCTWYGAWQTHVPWKHSPRSDDTLGSSLHSASVEQAESPLSTRTQQTSVPSHGASPCAAGLRFGGAEAPAGRQTPPRAAHAAVVVASPPAASVGPPAASGEAVEPASSLDRTVAICALHPVAAAAQERSIKKALVMRGRAFWRPIRLTASFLLRA